MSTRTFIQLLRPHIPDPFRRFAGFCKRLPLYWRFDRSADMSVQQRKPGLPIFVTPDACLSIPESLTAYINWRDHGLEDPGSAREARGFIELSNGRKALFDIGAQTGFISALFAMTRKGTVKIASIEPDVQVQAILDRARELNSTEETEWSIHHFAISDAAGVANIINCNTLYEARDKSLKAGDLIEVPTITLDEAVAKVGWVPDILKIDVESFEYEIITSSVDFLQKHRPAIQIEIHWALLRERGYDGIELLNILAKMGYTGLQKRYRTMKQWNRASSHELVSRISLLPPNAKND